MLHHYNPATLVKIQFMEIHFTWNSSEKSQQSDGSFFTTALGLDISYLFISVYYCGGIVVLPNKRKVALFKQKTKKTFRKHV